MCPKTGTILLVTHHFLFLYIPRLTLRNMRMAFSKKISSYYFYYYMKLCIFQPELSEPQWQQPCFDINMSSDLACIS